MVQCYNCCDWFHLDCVHPSQPERAFEACAHFRFICEGCLATDWQFASTVGAASNGTSMFIRDRFAHGAVIQPDWRAQLDEAKSESIRRRLEGMEPLLPAAAARTVEAPAAAARGDASGSGAAAGSGGGGGGGGAGDAPAPASAAIDDGIARIRAVTGAMARGGDLAGAVAYVRMLA
jgi:hypothetical protein